VKVDIKRLGLIKEDARIRDRLKNLISGNCPTLPQCGKEGVMMLLMTIMMRMIIIMMMMVIFLKFKYPQFVFILLN